MIVRRLKPLPPPSVYTIRGQWLLGGYPDGWHQRPYIEVRITNGRVYLAGEDLDMGGPTCPLRLNTDGHIAVWGINTTFAPKASDMKRIKRIGGTFA
jgi:hypothetical protein